MQMSQAIGGTGAQSARRYSLPLRVFYSYAQGLLPNSGTTGPDGMGGILG